jgi:hypothetical protein
MSRLITDLLDLVSITRGLLVSFIRVRKGELSSGVLDGICFLVSFSITMIKPYPKHDCIIIENEVPEQMFYQHQ